MFERNAASVKGLLKFCMSFNWKGLAADCIRYFVFFHTDQCHCLWTKVFFTLLWTNQKTCSETTASHHGVNWCNTTRNRDVFVSAPLPLSRGASWPVCLRCKQTSRNFCWEYRLGRPKWTWPTDIWDDYKLIYQISQFNVAVREGNEPER